MAGHPLLIREGGSNGHCVLSALPIFCCIMADQRLLSLAGMSQARGLDMNGCIFQVMVT